MFKGIILIEPTKDLLVYIFSNFRHNPETSYIGKNEVLYDI